MANSWTPSQQAAMNLRGKDLLVSAAAGSGKTSVLTERIIRSLLDPENPADLSRMLIVTFTRAAAAELKGKIAEALGKALAEDPDNPVLSRQIFLLGSAQISTIDAFFLKAVKANFDQLNLPATFRVADEKELFLLKNEVLSSLLGEFYKRYDQESDAPLSVKSISKNDFARVLDHLMSGRSDGKLWETLLDFYECFSSDPLGIDRLKVCADEILGNAEKDYFESSFGKEVKKYLNECFFAYEKSLCSVCEHLDAAPDMALKYTDVVHSDLDFCRRITQAATYREAHEYALSFRVHDLPRGKIQKTSEIIAYQTRRAGFKSSIAPIKIKG